MQIPIPYVLQIHDLQTTMGRGVGRNRIYTYRKDFGISLCKTNGSHNSMNKTFKGNEETLIMINSRQLKANNQKGYK